MTKFPVVVGREGTPSSDDTVHPVVPRLYTTFPLTRAEVRILVEQSRRKDVRIASLAEDVRGLTADLVARRTNPEKVIGELEAENKSLREKLLDSTYCDFHTPDNTLDCEECEEARADLTTGKEAT